MTSTTYPYVDEHDRMVYACCESEIGPVCQHRRADIQVNTYPQSDIVIGSLNDVDLVTCGTCGKKFPDIYPSARCPYEHEHKDIRKWTTDEAGCLIGGHHGWHGHAYKLDLAVQSGYPITKDQQLVLDCYRTGMPECDDCPDRMPDLMDKAEAWMNEHCAPEGYSFGWHEGEFFLQPDSWFLDNGLDVP